MSTTFRVTDTEKRHREMENRSKVTRSVLVHTKYAVEDHQGCNRLISAKGNSDHGCEIGFGPEWLLGRHL